MKYVRNRLDAHPWRLVINPIHLAHHRHVLLPPEVDALATAIGDVLDGLADGRTRFCSHPICHTLRFHREVALDFGSLRIMIFEKQDRVLELLSFLELSHQQQH